jgi:exosortase A-associated hydrolase 1
MRRLVSFECEGSNLWATLDEAPGRAGVLIVSGGNEIRIGAHRGMARLAADLAVTGVPVFRFDRRGIGDSEGENAGFEGSGPDIAAAIACFRAQCPQMERIVSFGNCDAASALVLHSIDGLSGLILANPWVIEETSDLPPTAAIRARYAERLRDPWEWWRLLSGEVNLAKLAKGLVKVARPAPTLTASSLPERVAVGLARVEGPVSLLLAERDNTAVAFMAAWKDAAFDAARQRGDLAITPLDSASHSFASESDYTVLKSAIVKMAGA